jgi:hypothetical protein
MNIITRRSLLAGAPVAAAAITVPSITAAGSFRPAETMEEPWDKANRLAEELSETLDQCNGGRWKAIVGPKSANKDQPAVMFTSINAEKSMAKHKRDRLDELVQMINDHLEALAAYSRCTDQEWETVEIRAPIDSTVDRTRKALLDHRCRNTTEVKVKGAFMAQCRSFYDWDDIERSALILALTPSVQS